MQGSWLASDPVVHYYFCIIASIIYSLNSSLISQLTWLKQQNWKTLVLSFNCLLTQVITAVISMAAGISITVLLIEHHYYTTKHNSTVQYMKHMIHLHIRIHIHLLWKWHNFDFLLSRINIFAETEAWKKQRHGKLKMVSSGPYKEFPVFPLPKENVIYLCIYILLIRIAQGDFHESIL